LLNEAKLILNGRVELNCRVVGKELIIDDINEFFGAVEKNVEDEKPECLNGFHKFMLDNKFNYHGFFVNDFIYCHKLLLSSSLHCSSDTSCEHLTRFLSQVDRFDGSIENQLVIGECSVTYKSGDAYEGCLDSRFFKYGNGRLLAKSGELYIGSFSNDCFNGLGKLIANDEVKLGFFVDGTLKTQFNSDLVKLENLKDLHNLTQYLQGTLNEDQIAQIFDKRVYLETKSKPNSVDDQSKSNQSCVLKTLYFDNGYSYQGMILNSFIVDKDFGILICASGDRIQTTYKSIEDKRLGALKSIDGKWLFIVDYSRNQVSEMDLNSDT
jgi:hypothetical protein